MTLSRLNPRADPFAPVNGYTRKWFAGVQQFRAQVMAKAVKESGLEKYIGPAPANVSRLRGSRTALLPYFSFATPLTFPLSFWVCLFIFTRGPSVARALVNYVAIQAVFMRLLAEWVDLFGVVGGL